MNENLSFFKSWILYKIMWLITGIIAGVLVGGILGLLLGMAKVNQQMISLISGIVGLFCSFYASFFFFKWSIKKYILQQSVPANTIEEI